MMITFVFKYLFFLAVLFWGLDVSAQVPSDDIKEIKQMIKQCERIGPEPTESGHVDIDKPNIDGIINPDSWFGNKTENRILFVLKEPWGNGGRNLPEEIISENKMPPDGWQTYKPMITIANMIEKGTRDYAGENSAANSEKSYTVFKNCSGIIEVNKFSGYTQSSNSLIARYAEKNLELLQRQIDVYKPTIVIIGVGEPASNVLVKKSDNGNSYIIFRKEYNNVRKVALANMCKYCYAYFTEKCVFIVTYHPSARIKKEIYCTSIYDVVKKWKDSK